MKGKNTVVVTLLLALMLSLSIPIGASADEHLDTMDDGASQESVMTEVSSEAQALAAHASKVAIENFVGAVNDTDEVDPYLAESDTDMEYVQPVVEEVQLAIVKVAEASVEQAEEAVKSVEPLEEPEEEIVVDGEELVESSVEEEYHWDGAVLTASKGVNQGPSGKETYYNLDMSGIVNGLNRGGWIYTQCVDQSLIDNILDTSGYWIRDDGCKMFGDYIMVAANLSVHPRGSLVPTSLGMGIVVDTGGFAKNNPNQLDIAVNW